MIWILCGAFLVALDQLTKFWAILALKNAVPVTAVPGVLQFSYVENTGIAFGFLQDMHWFVIPVNIVILLVCIFMARMFVKQNKKISVAALCLIASGAVGNLIDKIFRGYVVDFIETVFMDFPVFNLADVFVCCGAALLAFYILFLDKEEKDGNHL